MPFGAMAAATVAGAGIGVLGAKSAAKTQAGAADRAAQMQLQQFNTVRDDLSPYRSAGLSAIPGYQALLGIGSPTTGFSAGSFAGAPAAAPDWGSYGVANPDVATYYQQNAPQLAKMGYATPESFYQYHFQNHGQGEMATGQRPAWSPTGQQQPQAQSGPADNSGMQRFLESTPGYQFARDQGMQGITNQMAAKGLGGVSGAYGKGLARFVTGLANQTYQQQVTNYANAAGMGQNAANQTGAFGQAATTAAGNALQGGAAASAAGTVGAANATSGAVGALGSLPLTNKIMGMYQPTASAPGMAGLY